MDNFQQQQRIIFQVKNKLRLAKPQPFHYCIQTNSTKKHTQKAIIANEPNKKMPVGFKNQIGRKLP